MSQIGLGSFFSNLAVWGKAELAFAEDLGGGLVIKLAGDGFTAVGKAAQAYKDAIAAGATPSAAWAAAYNVLSAGAGSALTDAELTIADDIIQIFGTAPTPAG